MSKTLEIKLDKLEAKLDNHIVLFNARGKNHEDNARAMLEFTQDNNRLSDDNLKLREEVNLLKTEQAVHKVVLNQFGDITKELKVELRALGDKIVAEMSSIKTSITTSSTRETTIMWVGKVLFHMAALAGTLVGILKYIESSH